MPPSVPVAAPTAPAVRSEPEMAMGYTQEVFSGLMRVGGRALRAIRVLLGRGEGQTS